MLDAIIAMFMFVSPQTSNYDKVVQSIQQIAEQNPANSKIISIGVNDQGTPIQALQIGSGETPALIVGTHHGNEFGSTAVALGVADSLAKMPVPGHTVYVIPVLNISGYNKLSRYENGVKGSFDANRDYPSPCKSGANYNLKSTKALSDFIQAKDIQISATLHTYWPAVVYPWGISTNDTSTQYDSQYIELAKAATLESNYEIGNSTKVLYAADGTFEDYAYWQHGIWSLLFELGFSHRPDATAIKNMVDVNVPGLRRYIVNAPKKRVLAHHFTGRCDKFVMQRVWLE